MDDHPSDSDWANSSGSIRLHKRIGGLLRDAWYLAVVIAIAAIAMWIWLAPVMGVVAVVAGLSMFGYFGVVRYDDEGNERTDGRA